jgi:hypothetical protein
MKTYKELIYAAIKDKLNINKYVELFRKNPALRDFNDRLEFQKEVLAMEESQLKLDLIKMFFRIR